MSTKPNISPSFLDAQQDRLLQFVILMHGKQERKYTGEPYWYHLVNVAYRADIIAGRLGIEVALCHDLIEDTDCTYELLHHYLKAIGYMVFDIEDIVNGVRDLTDIFTPEAYPELKRKQRKRLEAQRLSKVCVHSQNVKLCDIEDNSDSIENSDPGFAKTWLSEKAQILALMKDGNPQLHAELVASLPK